MGFNIRVNKALGGPLGPLNLQFLMADLLEEQRDTTSLVAQATNYRANNAQKDQKQGSKKPKKSPNRGSNSPKQPEGEENKPNVTTRHATACASHVSPTFSLLSYVTRMPRRVDDCRRLATTVDYARKALVDDSRLSSTTQHSLSI